MDAEKDYRDCDGILLKPGDKIRHAKYPSTVWTIKESFGRYKIWSYDGTHTYTFYLGWNGEKDIEGDPRRCAKDFRLMKGEE